MPEIIFVPETVEAQTLWKEPRPAKLYVPEWYKKTPQFISKEYESYGISEDNVTVPNTTMKNCMPFLDALTSGYIYELPVDLELKKMGANNLVRWRYGTDIVTVHSGSQAPKIPEPQPSKDKTVFKFKFEFVIKTPKGYSCLFTHPFNRHDLPFRTFSGVVDTDSYELSIQFPFQIHADFGKQTILEKGTPVVQIIPFRREDWTSSKGEFNDVETRKNQYKFFSKIASVYKNNVWEKKHYV